MSQSEESLQNSFVQQFNLMYSDYLVILSLSGISLNGSPKERAMVMQSAKKAGLINGIADLQLVLPHGVTLNLEFKRPDGKGVQSDSQKLMESSLHKLGHTYFIVDSIDLAFKLIANHTEYTDRNFAFNQLFQQFSGETALSQPFMFYTTGTSIESIKSDFRPLYHLE